MEGGRQEGNIQGRVLSGSAPPSWINPKHGEQATARCPPLPAHFPGPPSLLNQRVRAESTICSDLEASANLEVARGLSRASWGDLGAAGPCGSPDPDEVSQTLGPSANFPSPLRAHLACTNVAPGPPAAPGSCRLRAAASMAAPLGNAVREERRLRGRLWAPGREEAGGGRRGV